MEPQNGEFSAPSLFRWFSPFDRQQLLLGGDVSALDARVSLHADESSWYVLVWFLWPPSLIPPRAAAFGGEPAFLTGVIGFAPLLTFEILLGLYVDGRDNAAPSLR